VTTALQRRIPAPVLGRAASTVNSLVFAPTAVTIPLGALLLSYTGYQAIMAATATLAAAVGALLLSRR
jgi:hypothetical protein